MNAQRGRLARQAARRQQRERLAGIVLAVIGVVVLIVAVVALRDPKSDSPANAGKTVAVSGSNAVRTPSSSRTPSPARMPSSTGSTSEPPVSLSGSGAASSTSSDAKSVPLVVLNDTTVPGLAKQAAQRFQNGGWTVTFSGNLTNDIISTCAYYDPEVNGAKAAAKILQAQYPVIQRVQPKFAGLPSGPIVVVLTPDYESG